MANSRATAYQDIFGRPNAGPRPQQQGYGAPEENAHYSPYAQYSQYQPYPPPVQHYYPQQHPPVQYGYGQYAPPPPAPMYGPRPPPQTPSQRPRSMVSGGYPPGIIPARPLPDEAPDPAIEQLTQQGLTHVQAYQENASTPTISPRSTERLGPQLT